MSTPSELRAAFEAAMESAGFHQDGLYDFRRNPDDTYRNLWVNDLWSGFQLGAALQSTKGEAPADPPLSERLIHSGPNAGRVKREFVRPEAQAPAQPAEPCHACGGTGVLQSHDSVGLVDQRACDLCGDEDA